MLTGASASNALGTLAVLYSCIHTATSYYEDDDSEIKSLCSGLLTGALYKVGRKQHWEEVYRITGAGGN